MADLAYDPKPGFEWHARALANPNDIGRTKDLPVHEDSLHFGYYRKRSEKGGKAVWQRVGVWPVKTEEGLVMRVYVDDVPVAADQHTKVFSYACRNPISYDVYSQVRAGKPWPDSPPPLTAFVGTIKNVGNEPLNVGGGMSLAPGEEMTVPASDRVVTRSDNAPAEDDYTIRKHVLAEEKGLVPIFLEKPITDQDGANKAAEWANRISRNAKWFRDTHRELKAPILEEGRRLDAAYLRPAEEAEALAKKLTQHQTPFLAAEQRRLEAEAQERQRTSEEEARRQADVPPPVDGPAAAAPDPAPRYPTSPPPPPKAKSGGASGRSTTLRVEKVAVISDYRLLAAFLITGGREGTPNNSCSNPDLKEALDKLAHRMAQTAIPDMPTPGFTVEERPVARR